MDEPERVPREAEAESAAPAEEPKVPNQSVGGDETRSASSARQRDWTPVRRIVAAWSAVCPNKGIADWGPVSRIVDSAWAAQSEDRQELTELLKKSNQLLCPLEDPFFADFGLHRWLSGSREEAYSDWLAWVVSEQIDTAAEAFELFDLEIPPDSHQWGNPAVIREPVIAGGRRLDVVLRWPGRALFVIEVKVTDEKSASVAKQQRYRKWMDGEPEPYKKAALLVIDPEAGCSEGGFQRSDWRRLCLKLRRMVVSRLGGGGKPIEMGRCDIVHCSLILAFAGAVEQNLLGMFGKPARLMSEGRHLLNVLPIKQYLRDFITGAPL